LTEVGTDRDDEGTALEREEVLLRIAGGAEQFFELLGTVHVSSNVVQGCGSVEDGTTQNAAREVRVTQANGRVGSAALVLGLGEEVLLTTSHLVTPDRVDETSLRRRANETVSKVTVVTDAVAVVKGARSSVQVVTTAKLNSVVVYGRHTLILTATIVECARISASLTRSSRIDVDVTRETRARVRTDITETGRIETARIRIAVIDEEATIERLVTE